MLNDFGKNKTDRLIVEECSRLSIKDFPLNRNLFKQIIIDNQIVYLTATKCYFGGSRYWFKCPNCKKRIGVLYRKPANVYFLCRSCLDLTYALRKYHRREEGYLYTLLNKLKQRSV